MANRSFRTWFEEQELQEFVLSSPLRIVGQPLVRAPLAAGDVAYHAGKAVAEPAGHALDAVQNTKNGEILKAMASAGKIPWSLAKNLFQAGPGAIFRFLNRAATPSDTGDYIQDIKQGRLNYA